MTANATTGGPDALQWSADTVEAVVRGVPARVYAVRRRSLAELLLDARRWRDREFLVQASRRLHYGQYENAVSAGARLLAERGVGPGDRVLLAGFNSIEWVVALGSALSVGAVVALGNAWWSDEELAGVLADVQPLTTVADPGVGARIGTGDWLPIDAFDPWRLPADAGALILPAVTEDDPALVVFTSGSTGRPKGAVLSHHGIIAAQQNLLASTGRLPHTLAPDHRPIVSLMTSPLFHLSGVGPLITAMLVGGTMVFLEGRLEPAEVLELIQRESVTVWGAVPTAVQRVLAHPDLARYNVSSLRTIGLGGAPMPPGLGASVRAAFPTVRRGASQIYGMTETNGIVAAASGAEMTARPGTTGRPMPVVEVRIDQPDAEGNGEILVRGPTVMLGYLGHGDGPGPGAESPIRPDGFLRTGDVGRLDADGYLYVTGRVKDIIIRGGENIGAGQVEQVIGELPQVREVAVVGLPHPELGEEVAAAVVLTQPQTTVDDLRAAVRQRLAYFEVPTQWWLRRDDLPTTPSGKIDKMAIMRDWPTGG